MEKIWVIVIRKKRHLICRVHMVFSPPLTGPRNQAMLFVSWPCRLTSESLSTEQTMKVIIIGIAIFPDTHKPPQCSTDGSLLF